MINNNKIIMIQSNDFYLLNQDLYYEKYIDYISSRHFGAFLQ